jgi:diguanylate cyclase (GGDEF)-like protein
MLKTIDKYLNNSPQWAIFIGVSVFIIILTLLNYYTRSEVALSILLIVPIYIVAWYVGPFSSIIISLAAALSWDLNDIYSGIVFSHYVIPYLNTLIRFNVFTIICLFLMEIRGQLNQMGDLADTDGLTGIANIRCFHENVYLEAKRNTRYKHPFSIAYIDVDDFKQINDTHGHDTGDRVLRDIANTLKSNLRSSDIIARIGGDEFAFLLSETDYKSSEEVLNRIRKSLLLTMDLNRWAVTFSIGAITFTEGSIDFNHMIKAVDNVLYEAKKSGKNKIIHEQW